MLHIFAALSGIPLDFPTRLRIALGSARRILYLHIKANPPIFHCDIKASNILLDHRKVAKVDFRLSRLALVPDMEGLTPSHFSMVVKGAPGYMDPEYFLTHKLTDKSDVYSFGVVLLELIMGVHAISKGKNIFREVKIITTWLCELLGPLQNSTPHPHPILGFGPYLISLDNSLSIIINSFFSSTFSSSFSFFFRATSLTCFFG